MSRYRYYDHRIKQMIAESKNPNLFPQLGIPRSTAREWIKKQQFDVVTLPELNVSGDLLTVQVSNLKNEIEAFKTKQKLVIFTFKLFGLQIQYQRLPNPGDKNLLLEAIKSAANNISLQSCLDSIGLSLARYRNWIKSSRRCDIPNMSQCPRHHPTSLTSHEVDKIKEYVTDKRFAHFSIASLSIYAKKQADVFASPISWSRIIRKFKLRRPLKRIYPQKPKVGIRASSPNQIWHIDISIIKLQDGTKCFIQAVIDNRSRYILACKATLNYGGIRTKELLVEALNKIPSRQLKPTIMCDKGSENINSEVDGLLQEKELCRVIAQIDVEQSNSMVEALFRRMKHSYLFKQSLSSFDILEKKIDYYVNESNSVIPMAVLGGATPAEIFEGRFDHNAISNMANKHRQAVRQRILTNQQAGCEVCLV